MILVHNVDFVLQQRSARLLSWLAGGTVAIKEASLPGCAAAAASVVRFLCGAEPIDLGGHDTGYFWSWSRFDRGV